jgi:hypothetical protein
VIVSSVTASACVAGSARPARSSRTVTRSNAFSPPGTRAQTAARAASAFASMSRPVSTKVPSFRHPPAISAPTFTVSGAGSPRAPLIRTRSGPSCDRETVSSRVTTSGPRYAGPSISYSS